MIILANETDPWGSLWREMSTATWVAATGFPLLATLVSIVAAFIAVSWQISKDQDALRQAKRREVAAALGKDLRLAADEMRKVVNDSTPDCRFFPGEMTGGLLDIFVDAHGRVRRAGQWIGTSTGNELVRYLTTVNARWYEFISSAEQLIKDGVPADEVYEALRTLASRDHRKLDQISLELTDWLGDLSEPVALTKLDLPSLKPLAETESEKWKQEQFALLPKVIETKRKLTTALQEGQGGYHELAKELLQVLNSADADERNRRRTLHAVLRFVTAWLALSLAVFAIIEIVMLVSR